MNRSQLAGKTAGGTWTESLGRATDKIAQQATRVKGKWVERKRRATSPRALPAPSADTPAEDTVRPRIVRASVRGRHRSGRWTRAFL